MNGIGIILLVIAAIAILALIKSSKKGKKPTRPRLVAPVAPVANAPIETIDAELKKIEDELYNIAKQTMISIEMTYEEKVTLMDQISENFQKMDEPDMKRIYKRLFKNTLAVYAKLFASNTELMQDIDNATEEVNKFDFIDIYDYRIFTLKLLDILDKGIEYASKINHIDFEVRGIYHRTAEERKAASELKLGAELILIPEPDNKADANALKVTIAKSGIMIGYVEKRVAKALANSYQSFSYQVTTVFCNEDDIQVFVRAEKL